MPDSLTLKLKVAIVCKKLIAIPISNWEDRT